MLVRRYSEDHARARHGVQRREIQASGLEEKAANDSLIRQKTCRARAAERPARYSGAFLR